ncbi:putative Ribonuclease H-like domain-containing protein [Seiridium cardinale]|uniref:Ribonuclease H-like domain-containing protein n=1 Tax=Seiridium cardinale TaxID=138064 RepID=A0ABR2XYU2_9PEZI
MANTLISKTAELATFVSSISPSSTLYLDMEGNSLGRHGTITLFTILVHPQGVVKIIDVLLLGESSFHTDARNDADAFWALYQVSLTGVLDVQLLENASRIGGKTYLHGLEKAIKFDLRLGYLELDRWTRRKNSIRNLMSSNVFAVRPVSDEVAQYCVNDVTYLPRLHDLYMERISVEWPRKVEEESSRWAAEAHSATYEPRSATKAVGPWRAGGERHVLTREEELEKELEALEDLRIEILSRGYFGCESDDDWYNDGPTSCRDVINNEDYYYYYDD